ncbi:MAG: hypothetical protein IT488_05830 [Gammaproteobacteria bacterium]|nr:hypothetical protein [Gammaproteobacteria bacterium]
MDSIIIKLVVISLLVGLLIAIALGDRSIRKEREQEERELREREAPGEAE